MKSIKITTFRILSSCVKMQNPLVTNGYLRPRGIQKAIVRDIKHVSLLRVSFKRKALITKRLSLQFQRRTRLELLWHL